MTELEKILKNLHDLRKYLEDKEWSDELDAPYINTVMKAEELLKKQEPVKPRSVSRHGVNPQIQHFCGNCNAILFHHKQKYCIECGRAVKWDA